MISSRPTADQSTVCQPKNPVIVRKSIDWQQSRRGSAVPKCEQAGFEIFQNVTRLFFASRKYGPKSFGETSAPVAADSAINSDESNGPFGQIVRRFHIRRRDEREKKFAMCHKSFGKILSFATGRHTGRRGGKDQCFLRMQKWCQNRCNRSRIFGASIAKRRRRTDDHLGRTAGGVRP